MLSGYACPTCNGPLTMLRDSRCRCSSCTHEFDPTIAFQACLTCGGRPRVRIRRYECCQCRAEIVSRFLFDGLVFDATYFRQKMAESRERKQERCERVRRMLAESRSPAADVFPADLDSVPGLAAALDELTRGLDPPHRVEAREEFDLRRYEAHVQAHCGPIAVSLEEIPPLNDDARYDLVWRFIAVIFLAHAGLIGVWQEGRSILVIKRETH